MRLTRHSTLLCVVASLAIAWCAPRAVAQVVIDMPAPKKPVQRSVQAPKTAKAAAESVSVGAVALTRYARARTEPYNVYRAAPNYASIRSYGYPFFVGPVIWNHGPFFFGRLHHHHGLCF